MARASVSSRRSPSTRFSTGRLPPGSAILPLLLLLVLLAALGAAAFFLWPFLGIGLVPMALWLAAVFLTARRAPRVLGRRANLLAASIPLLVSVLALLQLLYPGQVGRVGHTLGAPYLGYGLAPLLLGLLAAPWIVTPRRTWKAHKTTYRAIRRAWRGIRWAMAALRKGYTKAPMHHYALGAAAFLSRAVLLFAFSIWASIRSRRLTLARPAFAPKYTFARNGRVAPPRSPKPVAKAADPTGGKEKGGQPAVPDSRRGSRMLVGWQLPPTGLLEVGEEAVVSEEANLATASLIEQTLEDYGIEASIEQIRPGPTVTQFGIVPGWLRRYRDARERDRNGRPKLDRFGRPVVTRLEEKTRVKVDTILAREKDLALALAARNIRFEAPVPGEGVIGLEVPNKRAVLVTLRSVMESHSFQVLQRRAHLPIALGKGPGGEPEVLDLCEMPHILIGGATGSGKSVCIHSFLCCLLMRKSPWELRLLLVDPKRVELAPYNGVPHLLAPVIEEPQETVPILKGIIREMELRYKRLKEAEVRNVESFNQNVRPIEEKMPYIVVLIDELADLMMTSSVEVEHALVRLAQKGRAVGIHLVVATQRPSVDVITGLIKANFPSRLSFSVSSQVDSRVILDGVGAEKLLGKGDMLFLPTNYPQPRRIQGVYVSDQEVGRIVSFWKSQKSALPPPILLNTEEDEATSADDDLLEKASQLTLSHNKVSASYLQRKLGIGYPRASRLIDRMDELGIIAGGEPGRSRNVLRDDLEEPPVREEGA
ncbi:MAG: DNA translocase FtsK [Chloroflexi bacterium]|nr:DNA translocase FtsK [Chloroflexota bacterium]